MRRRALAGTTTMTEAMMCGGAASSFVPAILGVAAVMLLAINLLSGGMPSRPSSSFHAASAADGGHPILRQQQRLRQEQTHSKGHSPNSADNATQRLRKARLLPLPLDLIRRGLPVDAVYDFEFEFEFDSERGSQSDDDNACSCANPGASYECCKRDMYRSHKFGTVLSKTLFRQYSMPPATTKNKKNYGNSTQAPVVGIRNHPWEFTLTDRPPKSDFRDVLLFRNIYDAIISGYLFHKSGQECGRMGQYWRYLDEWSEYLSFDLPLLSSGGESDSRHLCQYLADEPDEVGLRAYVDWVFRYYYGGILSHYALSLGVRQIGERVKTVCYEQFMNSDTDRQTIESVLEFWYNGTDYQPKWEGKLPGHQVYDGEHATTKDEEVRNRLKELVKTVDEKYYNGEVAFVDTILPC